VAHAERGNDGRGGLRIAPVREVPSPWSQLRCALFRLEQLPFALISARDPKLGLSELKAATAHETLPVIFWESERPGAHWLEQLSLVGRLANSPGLLPDPSSERTIIVVRPDLTYPNDRDIKSNYQQLIDSMLSSKARDSGF
jgi:hypothetical protein